MLGYFVPSQFEVDKETSEATIRVLNKLYKHKVIEFINDDGPSMAVRQELIAECKENEILCVEEPYRLIMVHKCKKVQGCDLRGLPDLMR